MSPTEDYVTFLDSHGETISNDPRYRAKKILEAAGESTDADDALRESLDIETKRANDAEKAAQDAADEIATLKAALAAASAGVDDENEDDDTDTEDDYTSMGAKELKALANDRGVSIKGLKTVGEVRTALRTADAAAAAATA